MDDLAWLNSTVGAPGVVTFEAAESGLVRVAVTTPLAQAHIYLHGAHVTRFQPRGQSDLLFLSRQSHFAADKPIRGGIPVIFPWFGPRRGDPAAPQHGFARTAPWDVQSVESSPDGTVQIRLGLAPSQVSRPWLQNDFEVFYSISVGASLDLALRVRNNSAAALRFEEALHTYLSVSDVRTVALEGLDAVAYIDKVDGMKRKTQPPGALRIDRETDRVYLDTVGPVTVSDPAAHRSLVISKEGSRSTVVWNPWIDKAGAMSDFSDDEWPRMVCVETANVADNAVVLAPGEEHLMRASIGAQNL